MYMDIFFSIMVSFDMETGKNAFWIILWDKYQGSM